MKPSERLDELDLVFDLFLVVLSIITAALFQHFCTMIPLEVTKLNPNLTQSEFFQKVFEEITMGLRVLFIPLILLIGVWIVNRMFLRRSMRYRRLASEFCYLLAFSILLFDVLVLLGASFYPILTTQYPYNNLILPLLVFQYVTSNAVVYSYQIPFIYRENIRTRKEAIRGIWMPILVRTFIVWNVAFWLNTAILYVCVYS